MKPKEILDKYGITLKDSYYCYEAQAETKNSMLGYINQDCVIAYKKGFIGFIIIIRSARNHFAFIGIQKEIYLGGMDYCFRRCKLKQALKLLGEKYHILNEKEMDKVKNKTILEGLEKDNF